MATLLLRVTRMAATSCARMGWRPPVAIHVRHMGMFDNVQAALDDKKFATAKAMQGTRVKLVELDHV